MTEIDPRDDEITGLDRLVAERPVVVPVKAQPQRRAAAQDAGGDDGAVTADDGASAQQPSGI